MSDKMLEFERVLADRDGHAAYDFEDWKARLLALYTEALRENERLLDTNATLGNVTRLEKQIADLRRQLAEARDLNNNLPLTITDLTSRLAEALERERSRATIVTVIGVARPDGMVSYDLTDAIPPYAHITGATLTANIADWQQVPDGDWVTDGQALAEQIGELQAALAEAREDVSRLRGQCRGGADYGPLPAMKEDGGSNPSRPTAIDEVALMEEIIESGESPLHGGSNGECECGHTRESHQLYRDNSKPLHGCFETSCPCTEYRPSVPASG